MAWPRLPARIEQRCKFPRIGVAAGDVRSLGTVAEEAGQGEVILGRWSIVLFCDDVVNLERDGGKGLGKVAVFAAFLCPLPHQGNKRPVHGRSMAMVGLPDSAEGLGPQKIEFEADLAVVLQFLQLACGKVTCLVFQVPWPASQSFQEGPGP
jgi:hypothetical protein